MFFLNCTCALTLSGFSGGALAQEGVKAAINPKVKKTASGDLAGFFLFFILKGRAYPLYAI
jgi:hypothetical protein